MEKKTINISFITMLILKQGNHLEKHISAVICMDMKVGHFEKMLKIILKPSKFGFGGEFLITKSKEVTDPWIN